MHIAVERPDYCFLMLSKGYWKSAETLRFFITEMKQHKADPSEIVERFLPCIFLARQAVELKIKTILLKQGNFKKGHELTALITDIRESEFSARFQELCTDLEKYDKDGIASRYLIDFDHYSNSWKLLNEQLCSMNFEDFDEIFTTHGAINWGLDEYLKCIEGES